MRSDAKRGLLWTVLMLAAGCSPAGGGGDPDGLLLGTPRDRGPTADATPDHESDAAPEPDAALEPDPDATLAPDPDATLEPDPDATLDPEPDATPDPEPDAGPDPEPDAGPDPEPDAGPDPEPDPPAEGCGVPVPRPDIAPRVDGRRWRVEAFPSAHVGPRGVTVLLPAAYADAPDADFPVMYLHDGQNLFDRRDAAFGVEWQVDETVDALTAAGAIEPLIVVGVDNTPDRIAEYTPSAVPEFEGSGGSAAYARFLVDELKPWIDARLRTRCAPEETGVGGSSLGGLVSLDLRRRHPGVFGRVAALSPSLWWNDREALGWAGALADDFTPGARIWIDGGNAEGGDDDGDGLRSVVEDVEALFGAVRAGGVPFPEGLAMRVEARGAHNEATWAGRLPSVLAWLWGPETAGPPDSLVGGPLRLPLAPGSEAPLRVDGEWGGGVQLTLPPADVELASLTPMIVAVDGDRVRALRPGPARVQAQLGAVDGVLEFEVIADGQTVIAVTVPPETPADDTIHVAGGHPALGAWDPAGLPLARAADGRWTAILPVEVGAVFEFKITRGTWETVEKGPDGEEIPNRIGLADGVPVEVEVARWVDVQP